MAKQKHLGVSAVMGNVYYGSISKDRMCWLADKVEIPKSEFIQAIFDWVKNESGGDNAVQIKRIGDNGKESLYAEITVKYHIAEGSE